MNQYMIEWFIICFKQSYFYVLQLKTVWFPYRERTVFNWRTYGFDMETIKGMPLASII